MKLFNFSIIFNDPTNDRFGIVRAGSLGERIFEISGTFLDRETSYLQGSSEISVSIYEQLLNEEFDESAMYFLADDESSAVDVVELGHDLDRPNRIDAGRPYFPTPPLGELCLRFILPRDNRKAIIGDLEEEYNLTMLPRFGRRMANVWYWKQVLGSLGPTVSRGLLFLAGCFGFNKMSEWLGRLSGS